MLKWLVNYLQETVKHKPKEIPENKELNIDIVVDIDKDLHT